MTTAGPGGALAREIGLGILALGLPVYRLWGYARDKVDGGRSR